MKSGKLKKTNLYLITDDLRSRGREADEVASEAVRGGVKMLQYRPWEKSDSEILAMARKLRDITADSGCALLINGRPDVAVAVGADGIHTGDSSIPVSEARRILGSGYIVGYSAHSAEGAERAQFDGADFVTYSPLFPTTSNSAPRETVKIEDVAALSVTLKIPLFALGGIGEKEIPVLKMNGIKRVAIISAITESDNIELAVREILSLLG